MNHFLNSCVTCFKGVKKIEDMMSRKLSKYEDEKLLKLMSGTKEEADSAFTEFYERYSSRIKGYCVVALNDEDQAEDIFQETFIRFYNNVKVENKVINVPGFLITIARNLILNYKRDKKQTVPIEDINLDFDNNNNYEKTELWELINMALDLLEFKYKEVFVLRELNNFSIKEIAEICNETVACVKSRVFRAHSKIQEILAPYLQDIKENS